MLKLVMFCCKADGKLQWLPFSSLNEYFTFVYVDKETNGDNSDYNTQLLDVYGASELSIRAKGSKGLWSS